MPEPPINSLTLAYCGLLTGRCSRHNAGALGSAIADFAGQARSIFEGIPKRVKNSLPSLRAREIKIIEREIVKARNAAADIQIKFD